MTEVPKTFIHVYFGVLTWKNSPHSEVTGDCLWLPKVTVPKVINEKEENVWPLISPSSTPGEKKGEEDKHVSGLHQLPGNDLRET